jgi:hypothetical protein
LRGYGWLILRTFFLALVFSGLVAGIGWLGDQLNIEAGVVPLWDQESLGYWLSAIVLVLVTAINYGLFDNPPEQVESNGTSKTLPRPDGGFETNWVLPTLVVLSTVLLLGVYRGTAAITIGVILTFTGLMIGPLARHFMSIAGLAGRERARVIFTLLVHGIAFLTLSMIYIHKVRSLFSATAVLIVGILLLIALTEGEEELFVRRLVYALVGGLMLGQVTWALNYWQATGWTGGAVLLVCFYLFGGLILTHLRSSVHLRDVIEYGAVSSVALGIVVYSLLV